MRKEEIQKVRQNFGDRLRKWIKNMGLSITDFARETGLNLRSVHHWLKGEKSPTLDHLASIPASIDYLIEGRLRPVYPFFRNVDSQEEKFLKDNYEEMLSFLTFAVTKDNFLLNEFPYQRFFSLAIFIADSLWNIYSSLMLGTKPYFTCI